VQAGWGATGSHDGVPAASHAISNTGNIPIEAIEHDFPLRILAYELLPDTGGAGTFRGAPAVAREYEILADGVAVNYRLERRTFPPEGSHGAGPGSPAGCHVRRDGGSSWQELPAKGSVALDAGDRLRVELPGGAGFGRPAGRPPEAVRSDRAAGLLSAEAARREYNA
jgi:N-methylhydantoinase B